MLTEAAFHVPVMPLSEVVGRTGTDPFSQMVNEVPNANVGGIFGATVTVNVAGVAHPPPGVKV